MSEAFTLSALISGPNLTAKRIFVDDKPVKLRENVYKVLRRIRNDSWAPRQVWLDAICINQFDHAEKAHQVALMAKVYRSTKESLLWLGEVEDEPIYPFQPLESADYYDLMLLEEKVQQSGLESPRPLENSLTDAPINVPAAFEVVNLLAEGKHLYEMPFYQVLPTGKVEFREDWPMAMYSLSNLLQRTWWRRIWTVQEAFLPPDAIIRVGPYSAPFLTFLKGAITWHRHVWLDRVPCDCPSFHSSWIGHVSADLKPFLYRVADLAELHASRSNPNQSMAAHSIYLLSINRSAWLDHDRVYGILGLIQEFLIHYSETPDYSRELAPLYASTSFKMMENARHLCLLPYARPLEAGTQSLIYQLPSWTPNWSASYGGHYFDIENNGGFTADAELPYDGGHLGSAVLKLEGLAMERISDVGTLIHDMMTEPGSFVPIVQAWLNMVTSKGLSARALWEVIHVATHKNVGLGVIEEQAEWWDMLKVLAEDGASHHDMDNAAKGTPYWNCKDSMECLETRAVFVTEPLLSANEPDNQPINISEYRNAVPHGSVGLALPNVQVEDVVFVVKGARAPLIFRPLLDKSLMRRAFSNGVPESEIENCFTFVGVCYVYGMMQGQAVSDSTLWRSIYIL